jgi:hypothetical protein
MTMSWLETVSNRAGLSVDQAEASLHRRGISADRATRPTPTLTITSVKFRGKKQGKLTDPIDFSWSDLSSGVWAVTSHGNTGKSNLVGKSSVLEIILWCLRGEPKGLQDDVRSWLDWVRVSFNLDERQYAVEFDVTNKKPNGALIKCRPDGAFDEVDRFSSDEGFAAAMSRFMMNTFDLDPIPSRQKNDEGGITISHGWTALSGGLYFGGDHKVLLGDVVMGGLPARMLQVFVGLPWASTVMQAATVKKELEQQLEHASRITAATSDRTSLSRERIASDLKNAREVLKTSSSELVTAQSLDRLSVKISHLSTQTLALEQSLVNATIEISALQNTADADERALRNLRENLVTTAFFNGLLPSCCPRCETAVPKERIRREGEDQSCSLCSEPIMLDSDDPSDAIEEANDRFALSSNALTNAKSLLKQLEFNHKKVETDLKSAKGELDAATKSNAFQQRRDAELVVARLEGALQEYNIPPVGHQPPEDIVLASIAHDEAKLAFDASKGDLLDKLNQEILRLGNAFGALGLEHIQLSSESRMSVIKGGQKTSFSKLTPGERLRLRIATAIALLRIGQECGVGRHPGLLIIDSPGAEETSESDLASLLQELRKVADETPGLQIMVASANAPSVISALGDERCRVAPEGGYVW